ncbi:M48 family metallopeptidase [Nocardioides sp. GY 10113]|nr:M48 family metallopeptidase [Nocardioides sp. GY 10113]
MAIRVAAASLAVGVAVLVGLAAWLVPWSPVPGGAPDPAAAESLFSAAQIQRAEEFATWARVWSWSTLAISLALVGWLGFSRTGRRWAAAVPGPWWSRAVILVALVSLAVRLVTLPTRIGYRRLLLHEGLATSSWAGWARDQAVSLLLSIVVTAVALVLATACARRWRRSWPAVVAGGAATAVLLGSYVYPVLVEPLFNSFEPLPQGQLRSEILDLADREQVGVDDVLVSDASRRTSTLNAYVSGFGSTRRVVLYDNLVRDLPEDEALAVVAHELAHAKYDDVLVGTLLGMAGAVAASGLMALVLLRTRRRGATPRREGAARSREGSAWLRDGTVVPVVLALLAFGGLLASPLENGISRRVETRADVVALETTGRASSFVALQKELALTSLADPTPPRLSQWWFGSHPTVLQRVALASRVP